MEQRADALPSSGDRHADLMEVVYNATREEQLAVIRAHPELAGKAALAGDLSEASQSEQASAGLDQLTRAEFDHFHALNAAYRARFDFPFIIYVRLTAGIAWIGSSFYFAWLVNHLKPPKDGTASGEVWSVYGGGFYHRQKYQAAPAQMPDDLHWFEWEAYCTWISGFALLILVHYVGAQNYLVDPAKAALSSAAAIAIGVAALVAGWVFYHTLCRSRLKSNGPVLGAIWFAFLITAAWFLDSIFNARGAYLHIGAILGTVMAANVFVVIIPNQRKVVAALIAGETPDPALGKAAKQRSVHNNYMTLPVLFIMMSHHYTMTYGADRPWLVLALLGLSGVAIIMCRYWYRRMHIRRIAAVEVT